MTGRDGVSRNGAVPRNDASMTTHPPASTRPDAEARAHPITHLMVPVEHALDRLVRYENHLYRQLFRAHDRLLTMQAARRRRAHTGDAI